MDHNEIRQKDTQTWNLYQTQIVDFILKDLGLSDLFSPDEVNRCIGILRTNGIESKSLDGSARFRCIFPRMSLLSHGCISNARCVQRNDSLIEIIAQRDIDEGEDIFISYTSLLLNNRARRKTLKNNW